MTHQDALTIIEQLRELVPTSDGKWCPRCDKVVPLDKHQDWEKQTTCPECGGELPLYDADSTVDLISEVDRILAPLPADMGAIRAPVGTSSNTAQ